MADTALVDHADRPDHGTTYYAAHWAAYKGHVRGILRGLMVGAFFGGLVGLGLFMLAGPLGILAMAGTGFSAGALIAGFTAVGGIMGSEIMGRVGNAAGNIASHAAHTELRLRYPNPPAISPESPLPGWGHHYEVPAGRDKGKFWNWRVGLSGLAVGSGFGWLFGISHVADHLLGHGATHLVEGAVAGALDIGITGGLTTLLPMVAGGLFGLSFGIERGVFKSIFNLTDNIMQGKFRGPSEAELQKDREHYRMLCAFSEPSEITSLQRQEEYERLQNEYFKAGFKAGFSGNARGLLGGIIVGGLSGLVLGAGLVTGLTLLSVSLPAAVPGLIVLVTAALGSSIGFKIFTEAAFEAAAHTEVDELQKVRFQYIRKGQDIDFEKAVHVIDSRRRGDPDLTPPDAEDGQWFKPKMLVMGALLGAVSGALLAPLAGPTLATMILGHSVAATVGTGISAATFGLLGATFGIGPKITGGLINLGDSIFFGTFNPGDKHPNIKTYGEIPLTEKSSPFSPERQRYVEAAKIAIESASPPGEQHHVPNQAHDTGPPPQPEFIRQILAERNEGRKQQAMANFRDRLNLEAQPPLDQSLPVTVTAIRS